jgi:WD40 repeat protein
MINIKDLIGPNGVLKIYDALTLHSEANIDVGYENRIWSIAFSSNGKLLASGSSDSTIKVWNIVFLNI